MMHIPTLRFQKQTKRRATLVFLALEVTLLVIAFLLFAAPRHIVVLEPSGILLGKAWELNTGGPTDSDFDVPPPDLDLHAYGPLGLHVGVNYDSGEFEAQIPGVAYSGDLYASEEYIQLPSWMPVRWVVAAEDAAKMLEKRPFYAEQIDSLEDEYELQVRRDSDFGIPYKGTGDLVKLPGQLIDPGEYMRHRISFRNEELTIAEAERINRPGRGLAMIAPNIARSHSTPGGILLLGLLALVVVPFAIIWFGIGWYTDGKHGWRLWVPRILRILVTLGALGLTALVGVGIVSQLL